MRFVKIITIAATAATFSFCLTDPFFPKTIFPKTTPGLPKEPLGLRMQDLFGPNAFPVT